MPTPPFCRSVMLSVLSADIRWCLVAGRRGRVRAREGLGVRGGWRGQNYLRKKASNCVLPDESIGKTGVVNINCASFASWGLCRSLASGTCLSSLQHSRGFFPDRN